jgi:hypothetical protein
MKLAAAAVAVTAGVVGAMFIPSAPAVAYYSGGLFLDITVLSPARLLAGGAAIDVPVEYTCNAQYPQVYVAVTQRVSGQAIASGSTNVSLTCSGGHQRTTVTITASGNRAFAKGTAFATGRIDGCLPVNYVCGVESRDSTITLRR